jgi:phasin family protein
MTSRIVKGAKKPAKAKPLQAEAAAETAVIQAEQAIAAGKEQFARLAAESKKGFDEAAAFGQAYVDALVKSGSIWTRTAEEAARSWTNFTQSAFERGIETSKAMLAAKTLRELTELQSGYTREALDGLIAETTKASELALKAANDAIEPISAQVNDAWTKISRQAAAAR